MKLLLLRGRSRGDGWFLRRRHHAVLHQTGLEGLVHAIQRQSVTEALVPKMRSIITKTHIHMSIEY